MLKNARDAIERIISQESKRNVAVKVNKEYNTGAKWQIHNNNKHYKYRERSQNNKNNVKIFKFNVNVRMCMLLSWAALLTNWFQQSNAHTNTHLYGRHTLFSLLHFTYTDIWYMNIRCGFFSLFRCECVRYFFLFIAVFGYFLSIYFSINFLKYTVHLFMNVSFSLWSFEEMKKRRSVAPRQTREEKKATHKRKTHTCVQASKKV